MKTTIQRTIGGTVLALLWFAASLPNRAAEKPAPYVPAGAPIIVCNPETQVIQENSPAEFTVIADSPSPPEAYSWYLAYQWQRQGPGLTNYVNIRGATSNTFSISHVSTNDVAFYRVEVSSTNGTSISQPAQLLVYTHHSPLTVYGSPLKISSSGTGCPGPYAGYVNYKKAVPTWGWTPNHGGGIVLHSAKDNTRSDTKVLVQGISNDSFCQQTTIVNTHPGAPTPEDTTYRFTIYLPNNVTTNAYPITLDGFNE